IGARGARIQDQLLSLSLGVVELDPLEGARQRVDAEAIACPLVDGLALVTSELREIAGAEVVQQPGLSLFQLGRSQGGAVRSLAREIGGHGTTPRSQRWSCCRSRDRIVPSPCASGRSGRS